MHFTKLALISLIMTTAFNLKALAGEQKALKSFCADNSEQILKEQFISSRADLANADSKTQDLVWKYSILKSSKFHLSFTDYPYHVEKKVTVENYIDIEKNKPVHSIYFGHNAAGIKNFSFTTLDGAKISLDLYLTGYEGLCVVKVREIL